MIKVHALLEREYPATKLLLQVHDELVFEVPEADLDAVRTAVCSEMVGVAKLAVPLAVDAGDGRTWDEAH